MTLATYTPGPWYFASWQDAGGAKFYIAQQEGAPYTENFSDVADIICGTVSGEKYEVQKANATLIAAAPEMLAALRGAVCALAFAAERDPSFQSQYEQVSTAIDKAIGAACAN